MFFTVIMFDLEMVGRNAPPPMVRDAFERVRLVGLKSAFKASTSSFLYYKNLGNIRKKINNVGYKI